MALWRDRMTSYTHLCPNVWCQQPQGTELIAPLGVLVQATNTQADWIGKSEYDKYIELMYTGESHSSVHLVIARDGRCTQMVEFPRISYPLSYGGPSLRWFTVALEQQGPWQNEVTIQQYQTLASFVNDLGGIYGTFRAGDPASVYLASEDPDFFWQHGEGPWGFNRNQLWFQLWHEGSYQITPVACAEGTTFEPVSGSCAPLQGPGIAPPYTCDYPRAYNPASGLCELIQGPPAPWCSEGQWDPDLFRCVLPIYGPQPCPEGTYPNSAGDCEPRATPPPTICQPGYTYRNGLCEYNNPTVPMAPVPARCTGSTAPDCPQPIPPPPPGGDNRMLLYVGAGLLAIGGIILASKLAPAQAATAGAVMLALPP